MRRKDKVIISFVRNGRAPVYIVVSKRHQKAIYWSNEITVLNASETKNYDVLEEDCYDYDRSSDAYIRRGGPIR